MAYASFHNDPSSPNQPLKQNELSSGGLNDTKAIAKIYGYMGIGLLITGVVAFLVAWLISSQVNRLLAEGLQESIDKADGWLIGFIVAWVVSLVALLILSFVIPVRAARNGKSLWVPYVLYCVFMGVLLTAILLAGVSFYIIGEAFGITVLGFTAMFLIGWFTKKTISVFGYISMILGVGILIAGLAGLITFLVRGMTINQFFWFDLLIQLAIIVLLLLVTAIDTFRIKTIVARSGESTNIYLFCAYVMYCDFISILVRVIYVLARTQGRK